MNLFVYGTLLFPDIRELIGGRVWESQKATLIGYQIFRVNGAEFPGIVKADKFTKVAGEILTGLTETEMERFDRYEDKFYIRSTVTVEVGNIKNNTAPAETYEIPLNLAPQILSQQPWTREWFEENCYDRFFTRLTGGF